MNYLGTGIGFELNSDINFPFVEISAVSGYYAT